jgi:hypothetical protein
MRTSKRCVAALLAASLGLAAGPQPASARSAASEVGVGVGVAFANLLYGPGKMMYAFFGGFIGLVAFGLSAGDDDVALRVIEPAWRGDYALTPAHLRGEREIEFFGRRAEHRAARDDGGGASDDGADTETGWE